MRSRATLRAAGSSNPGSTLFVVWNMATSDTERAGMFSPGRDLGSAFRAPGDHVFVVKMNYWLSL